MDDPTLEANALDVSQRIRVIRGQRLLLDSDLAALYGVKTVRLNEQVRRNSDRFPEHAVGVIDAGAGALEEAIWVCHAGVWGAGYQARGRRRRFGR